MTATTTPTVQSDTPAASETEPINLYKLGMLATTPTSWT